MFSKRAHVFPETRLLSRQWPSRNALGPTQFRALCCEVSCSTARLAPLRSAGRRRRRRFSGDSLANPPPSRAAQSGGSQRSRAHALDGIVAPHAVELAVRQHAQQARLQIKRHVADFIENRVPPRPARSAPRRASRAVKAPAPWESSDSSSPWDGRSFDGDNGPSATANACASHSPPSPCRSLIRRDSRDLAWPVCRARNTPACRAPGPAFRGLFLALFVTSSRWLSSRAADEARRLGPINGLGR